MHKSDIDKLEDILINQEKYKQALRFREMELEESSSEQLPKHVIENKHLEDVQDPRTIRAGSNTSTVETTVMKREKDLRYQTLYTIVHNTPKFVRCLSDYERIIYDYRYRKINPVITEWDDIAVEIEKLAKHNENAYVTVGRTKTLNIRNAMLARLAEYIEYTPM